MDASSSPNVHRNVEFHIVKKIKFIKFSLLKTIKLGEFMLFYVEHKIVCILF